MEPENSQFDRNKSIGCGLAGCAGGLLLGLVGGGLLLVLLSLGLALNATVTPETQAAATSPDLRLTLSEDFLGRALQETTEDAVNLDILPGNQIRVRFDTVVEVFGAPVPVQIAALFELQLVGQTLAVALLDTEVMGVNLPAGVAGLLDENLPAINQNVNQAVWEVSSALGTDMVLTGLGTDETKLWFEARAAP